MLMTLLISVAVSACSKDDDEPVNGDFIGMWQESWYDDYINLNSDGTGFWSEIPNVTTADYNDGTATAIKWTYADEWFTITDTMNNECMFKGRIVTQTADKIIFREYACDEGGNIDVQKPTNGKYISEDSYGYYEVITFIRHK